MVNPMMQNSMMRGRQSSMDPQEELIRLMAAQQGQGAPSGARPQEAAGMDARLNALSMAPAAGPQAPMPMPMQQQSMPMQQQAMPAGSQQGDGADSEPDGDTDDQAMLDQVSNTLNSGAAGAARGAGTTEPPTDQNEWPDTIEEFTKRYGREPATDSEMEFYYGPDDTPDAPAERRA